VGDGGIWSPFEHEKLLRMNRSNLLEALAGSKMFALKFKDIDLSACSIAVIKNAALPAGAEEPSAEHEAGDSVVEMKITKTVGDMANGVGASGAPFFVRVRLPDAMSLGPAGECSSVLLVRSVCARLPVLARQLVGTSMRSCIFSYYYTRGLAAHRIC
jgi:hypothetical protein